MLCGATYHFGAILLTLYQTCILRRVCTAALQHRQSFFLDHLPPVPLTRRDPFFRSRAINVRTMLSVMI